MRQVYLDALDYADSFDDAERNGLVYQEPTQEGFIIREEIFDLVSSFLEVRSPRGWTVLFRRIYLDETLAEVGFHCGVTVERVSQMEAKALRCLRHPVIRNRLYRILTNTEYTTRRPSRYR